MLFTAATFLSCAKKSDSSSELLLFNARVYTLSWGEPDLEGRPADDAPYRDDRGWSPDADAVLIRDGRIVVAGTADEVRAQAGADARSLDLGGATVLPGLVESHTHIAELGGQLRQVDLTGVDTEDEAVRRVAERSRKTPAGEWILGHGWDEGAWADRYPTLDKLSDAVPDHPVVLASLHGFAVWGNRKALEIAGIGADTEDPSGGEIRRDGQGRPTGILLNRATRLLHDAVPKPSLAERERQILAGLEAMAEAGYVAVHEAGVGEAMLEAFVSLDERGALPLRVHAMLSAREPDLMDTWVERGPKSSEDRKLAIRSVKAYYDGALGSRGARLIEDYADRPGHRGVSGSDYDFDADRVAAMMRAGFQVGVHAIGDAGNREVLDFLERVFEGDPGAAAHRHRIEHAQILHPDDVDRFGRLGVVASMQPPHAMEDKGWAGDRLGPERLRGAYAWRSLRRAGARLAFNSDLPGSSHDIFYGLHSAITRTDPSGQPAGGWLPAEKMTAEEAVRGYTIWGSYSAFDEARAGTIEPGKRADLTILDVDPFVLGESDPARLLDGHVLATIVDGEVLHDALP